VTTTLKTDRSPEKRVLIVAGETSGDVYASTLIDVLLEIAPVRIFAVGGPQTALRNVHLLYDSTNWAAIGYIEALKQAPKLLFVLRNLKRFLREERPDLLILVDYPGFNMRLVKWARRLGIPTLYYFPPSKFAVQPRDVADAAAHIDMVAANFGFTYHVYKEAGAKVEFVGHPLKDLAKPSMSRDEAVRSFGLDPARPVIGLCPGSRKSELEFLLPIMLESARRLVQAKPDLQFVVPVVATESDCVYGIPKCDLRRQIETSGLPVRIVEGRIYDVMAAAEILLISSGTATLEAANIGTPMIIVYRVSLITEIVARFFNKLPRFIGLPNIILGRMACPEIIQHDLTVEKLADTALALVNSPERLAEQKKALTEVITHLGKSGAHRRVAELALQLLKLNPPES
jgi:lipid-A-disaccharide synthase